MEKIDFSILGTLFQWHAESAACYRFLQSFVNAYVPEAAGHGMACLCPPTWPAAL